MYANMKITFQHFDNDNINNNIKTFISFQGTLICMEENVCHHILVCKENEVCVFSVKERRVTTPSW